MSSKEPIIFDEFFDCYADALYKYLDSKGIDKVWLAKKITPKGQKVKSTQEKFSSWKKECTKPKEGTRELIGEILGVIIGLNNQGKWQVSPRRDKDRQANRLEEEPVRFRRMGPEKSTKPKNATVHIPFYRQVKPAAGGGRIIIPDDESDKVLVSLPRAYVTEKLHANPSEIIILEIWNDSMDPIIKSGDVVFITQNVKPPFEGHIFIIRMGESLLCKYIQELPGDKLRIFSENSRYKDFEIQLGEESQESFEIYGRIVGHLHSRL